MIDNALRQEDEFYKDANILDFPIIYQEKAEKDEESFGTTDSKDDLSSFSHLSYETPVKRSVKSTRIIRTIFTKKILDSIQWLSSHHDNESAIDSIPYVQFLLENLKLYEDNYFDDPYSSFLSALYDALVFNEAWIKLTKETFGGIHKILIPLNNNPGLTYDKVDKAICNLEKLGLDTTPF